MSVCQAINKEPAGDISKAALAVCTSHDENSDANEGLGDVHGHCDVLLGLWLVQTHSVVKLYACLIITSANHGEGG